MLRLMAAWWKGWSFEFLDVVPYLRQAPGSTGWMLRRRLREDGVWVSPYQLHRSLEKARSAGFVRVRLRCYWMVEPGSTLSEG